MFKLIARKILIFVLGKKRYLRLSWLFKYGPKYYKMGCYQNIDGWLPEMEALTLYKIALSLPNEHPVVVEIGSWLGKSSVVLGLGIRKKISPSLYCIDPFNASGDDLSIKDYKKVNKGIGMPIKDVFINNVKDCNVYKYIKILEGYSCDFVSDWSKQIDFLFIDGDHSYEAVLQDYQSWGKFVKPGGYIVLHDVVLEPRKDRNYHVGPGRVVREHILNSDKWEGEKFIGQLFIARKAEKYFLG